MVRYDLIYTISCTERINAFPTGYGDRNEKYSKKNLDIKTEKKIMVQNHNILVQE